MKMLTSVLIALTVHVLQESTKSSSGRKSGKQRRRGRLLWGKKKTAKSKHDVGECVVYFNLC